MKWLLTAGWMAWMCCLSLPAAGQEIVYDGQVVPHLRQTLGSRIRKVLFGADKLKIRPFGLSVGPNGEVICTDIDTGLVLQLDGSGTVERAIGGQRGGPRLVAPVALTVDSDGTVYVVDSQRRGVVRYGPGFTDAQVIIADPKARFTGVALSGKKLFLTDAEQHRVVVYGTDGQFLFSFGTRGSSPGAFNFPCGIAVWNERVFVLDALNFRVQVFDESGRFQRMFGRHGDAGGDFARPKGLAVHKNGYIFVSDAVFDNVQVFDQQGRFLAYFGSPGSGAGQFWNPAGIAFVDRETVLVADRYNERIQRFRIKGVSQ